MTERFTILYETEENPMEWDLIDNQEDCLIVTGNGKAICDLLNELDSENKKLKEGVEELNQICKYYEMRIKELSEQADAVREELRLCEEENNALQERNDRQYEILRKLYTLIENKDWKGLTAHMEELDKCEEQLRKEWRLYSD